MADDSTPDESEDDDYGPADFPVVGRRYKVADGDCCMNVAFEAVCLEARHGNWPELRTRWDNGVELEGHASAFEEVESGD